MFRPRFRPHTYSYVVSTAALVVALSSGAYATGLIGTSQIKNGAVTSSKLHGNAVTSSKVADGSLRAGDFNAAQRTVLAPRDQVGGFPNASAALFASTSSTTVSLGTFTPLRDSYASLAASLQFHCDTTGSYFLGGGVEIADGTGAVVGDAYFYAKSDCSGGYDMAYANGLANNGGQPALLHAGKTYTVQVDVNSIARSATVSLQSAKATYDLIPAG